MAKKPKKSTKRRKEEAHPTLFVWDGSIRLFEDGSMLALHTQITTEEWEIIVEQTVAYKVFLECLKQVACPILGEPWDEEDDWFRVQLDIAVSRMRNIDALLVAKHDQKEIAKAYTEKMRKNAKEVQEMVEQMREQKRDMLRGQYGLDGDSGDDDITPVSSL
jgi:hypothetical protein